jgi:aconitate decarboxylase
MYKLRLAHSTLNAALMNSSFIQGFEFDDFNIKAPWHANSVVLPALLAAAEHPFHTTTGRVKISGNEILLSTIAGFELGSRVGRALHGSEMLNQGWHSVSPIPRQFLLDHIANWLPPSGAQYLVPQPQQQLVQNPKLSPGQTEDVLGTACTQACGLMSAQHKSMAKCMQHGFAARDGLYGALMSQKGYTGINQVFERLYGGYLATFGQGSSFGPQYKENELVDGLGEGWRDIDGIRVKKYDSMEGTPAPIDCIATL